MKRIPEKYKNLAKVVFGLSLLAYLLSRVDFKAVITLFNQGNLVYLITGVSVLLLAFCGFQAIRFHWCIKNISQDFRTSIKLFFLGFLFNNMLPGNLGGDAVRILYLQKMKDKNLGKSTGLLLIYRLSGLATLIFGGIVYLLFHFSIIDRALEKLIQFSFDPGLKTGILVGVLAFGILLLVFSSKLRNKLLALFKEASQTRHLFLIRDYIGIIALAVAFHFSRMVGFYFLVSFFGSSIGLVHLVFVLCFTMVIALIPISFGALGLMEGAITSSLILFDVSAAAATGVALINRLVLIIIAAIGGMIYLFASANKMMDGEENPNTD